MYSKCLNPMIRVETDWTILTPPKYTTLEEFKKSCVSFINVRALYKSLGNVNAKAYIQEIVDKYRQGRLKSGIRSLNVVPCRHCINCQRKKAFEWTVRNSFEAQNYTDENIVFLTLTINDESLLKFFMTDDNVPTLNYYPFQLFLKRLRKTFSDYPLRFYMCGEYGGKNGRPHFHALIYGLPFEKLIPREYSRNSYGQWVYTSDIISSLWTYGFHTVALCNDYTTMYVSQYCTKKYVMKDFRLNKPEFNVMSRRPGIGAGIDISKLNEIYKDDKIYVKLGDRVYECKPFKFFDNLYQNNHGDDSLHKIKCNRILSHNHDSPLDSVDYDFDTDKNYSQYLEELEVFMRDTYKRKETLCVEE